MAGFIQVSPPSVEPLSLTDVKNHLRVTIPDDDSLITSYIVAAREYCEVYCNRAFAEQQWVLKLDTFPLYSSIHLPFPFFQQAAINSANPFGTMNWLSTPNYGVLASPQVPPEAQTLPNWGNIFLPKPPLVSVDSIVYQDVNNQQQTLATNQYVTVFENEPGYIKPLNTWPGTNTNTPNVVSITFTCGYANLTEYGFVNALPATVAMAMRLLITLWYEHREPVPKQYELMQQAVHTLLDQHRLIGFF